MGDQSGLPYYEEYVGAWKDGIGSLVGPSCSRNAHDEAVVARRAQLGTNPGHPLQRKTSELGGNIDISAPGTRGRRRPSPGLLARLGVPVGGRVRKLRAVGAQSSHLLKIECE